MITLLSPAKSLDYNPTGHTQESLPRMMDETAKLVKTMRNKSAKAIGELMSISPDLAKLNKQRYVGFEDTMTEENSKQAVLAFNGDVYQGLNTGTLSDEDLEWSQDHVRILSGLYGVLRPFDRIQPYRLEMGTRLKTRRGTNLYSFWGDRITKLINEDLENQDSKVIFNLASKEYYKAVNEKKVKGDIYQANFFEIRNGEQKFISFSAKKARGLLTRFIIDNRIDNPQDVIAFDREGYAFDPDQSNDREFIFVRQG